MQAVMRAFRQGWVLAAVLCATSCGGGGSSGSAPIPTPTPAANVVSVVVDAGPTATSPSVNTLFTTVTICVPGSTTQCQTIDHIQVDTASYGLRILGNPVLTLSLPVTLAADGNTLSECTQFVDGYSWGPVASADIQIGGEKASAVPVQVIGAPDFIAAPSDCSSTGPEEDTVAQFGANGIIGIGVFEQDCGSYCASYANSGDYYSCSATACVGSTAALTSQVLNLVPLFATDNNGTILDIPAVAGSGAVSVTGSLYFGIDTESNNGSGTQSVLSVDPNDGNFTIVFNGQTLSASFIDSGTNGIYFNDTALAQCTQTGFTDFYCPTATQNFSAVLTGLNDVSATETFSIDSAVGFSGDDAVLPTLGGTYSNSADTFDWGLPFYYGRRVATAIESHKTGVGTGPYVAF